MIMKRKGNVAWIEAGYLMVSKDGFKSLQVESIARAINKNKSSFYHYFGDLEIFEEALLEQHKNLAKQFALDANACENIIPDMIQLFINHKSDIFFHKQLRINREKPEHKKCFESVYNLFEEAIIEKWISFIQLENQSFLAKKFLELLSENFLLKITDDNFSEEWLINYLKDISNFMLGINSRPLK